MAAIAIYFVFTLLTCFSAYYIVMFDVGEMTRKIVTSILVMDISLFYFLFATLIMCDYLKRAGKKSARLCHIAIAKYGRKSEMGFQVIYY